MQSKIKNVAIGFASFPGSEIPDHESARDMGIHAKSEEIRRFIASNLIGHSDDIAAVVAKHFEITPQSARRHLTAMVKDGLISVSGKTKAMRYHPTAIANEDFQISTEGISEDVIWDRFIVRHISDLPDRVKQVLSITCTEMLNNVLDHSESDRINLTVLRNISFIQITIRDFGVGVFRKVQRAFNLADERQAILELSKGRLTTSPDQHSGYGIFFSSRMVDSFKLWSGNLFFVHYQDSDDWLVGIDSEMSGTYVQLTVNINSTISPKDVYDRFCSDPNGVPDLGFHKTHVPLKLAQFGKESLVSRSQAKSVLSRVDRFSEVVLDFKDVDFVGQGFIDEIFRVFKKQHPNTRIIALNANHNVNQLIQLANSIDNSVN